ncbi:MAG: hypothetical protein WCO42_02485 [bacterium]
MADIILSCPQCGNAVTVSEFVSAESITCLKCKAQIQIPARQPTDPAATPKLRLAVSKPPDPPSVASPAQPGKSRKAKTMAESDVRKYLPKGGKRRARARTVSTFEIKVLPWLFFFLLLVILGWLRFIPSVLGPDSHATLIQGGVWAILLLHFGVTFLAFGDDTFSGILCMIIPGYSLYFLFVQSDKMLLRGLVAALLIVFGWDFTIAAENVWGELYTAVSHWIATTETIKK